jgi:hypothetical protein
VKQRLQPGWSAAWLQRPLDPQLLEYAVYDVHTIMALYQHFNNKGVSQLQLAGCVLCRQLHACPGLCLVVQPLLERRDLNGDM